MSKSHKNGNSLHFILKSAVILYIFAFLADFILLNSIPVWGIVFVAATFLGVIITLLFINYTEFQKFGFIPIVAIATYEIINHATSKDPHVMIESIYYISVLFIALYFTFRVKKKKYHSKKR